MRKEKTPFEFRHTDAKIGEDLVAKHSEGFMIRMLNSDERIYYPGEFKGLSFAETASILLLLKCSF